MEISETGEQVPPMRALEITENTVKIMEFLVTEYWEE